MIPSCRSIDVSFGFAGNTSFDNWNKNVVGEQGILTFIHLERESPLYQNFLRLFFSFFFCSHTQ